ncbi:hypothetical protein LA733_1778 [Leptospira interrogans]|nr:hypothetical protein LA733_1778 [Leptospira interrogans]KWV27688.1 hypothetical protein LA702_1647 [Leptospira interrogans]
MGSELYRSILSMWELPQFIKIESVVFKCAKLPTKLRLSLKMMWELSQIMILRTNSKILGTHTFRKFFLRRTQIKMGFKFW